MTEVSVFEWAVFGNFHWTGRLNKKYGFFLFF